MQSVTMQPVTRANLQATLRLGVLPEQQPFVCDYAPIAAIALAKAFVGALGMQWLPYTFYRGDEPVGFVALAHTPDPGSPFWVFHFFIDARYQGQRLGKAALEVLIQAVQAQHPACQAIQLTHHPENEAARRLYTQGGFIPTGELLEGEPLYRLGLPRS